jgi:hypothetical protein
MVHNKSSKIHGVKMILVKNYGVPADLVDWHSVIDSKLSFVENYNKVFDYCKERRLIKPIYWCI